MNWQEIIATALATGALGFAGYAVREVLKIETIEEKVDHIRQRVDVLYDHLIATREGPDQG